MFTRCREAIPRPCRTVTKEWFRNGETRSDHGVGPFTRIAGAVEMHEEGLTNANATQRIHEDTPRRFDQRVGVFVARGFLLLEQGIECLFESLEKYHEYPRLRRGGFVSRNAPLNLQDPAGRVPWEPSGRQGQSPVVGHPLLRTLGRRRLWRERNFLRPSTRGC